MSSYKNISNIINKIFTFNLALIAVSAMALSSINAFAAAPNTAELIVGREESQTSSTISVCVRATDGPIHITDVSNWFDFDNSNLKAPTSVTEKGVYGNNNNGYANMKWEQVLPAPISPNTADKFSLRLDYSGNGDEGSKGITMSTTKPELFGKLKFDKINNGANNQISITKAGFFSTESQTPIQFKYINVTGDCRTSTVAAVENKVELITNPILNSKIITQAVSQETAQGVTTTAKPQANIVNIQSENKPLSFDSVRTGGLSMITIISLVCIILTSVYIYHKSKTKKKIEYNFENSVK